MWDFDTTGKREGPCPREAPGRAGGTVSCPREAQLSTRQTLRQDWRSNPLRFCVSSPP